MAKTYTVKKFEENSIAASEDWNDEASNVLSEFNGQIAAEQLPYNSIGLNKFVAPTIVNNVPTVPDESHKLGTGWVGSSQAYWFTKSNLTTFTSRIPEYASTAVLGPPRHQFQISDGSWYGAIVPLSLDLDEGAYLKIPTKEGMIKGCAMVDVEYYGFTRKTVGSEGQNFTGNYGTDGRVRLFVFVDGVMVATTGPQPAGRRKTYSLSFAIPVGSSDAAEIDIRVAFSFDTSDNTTTTFDDDPEINVYNSQLWLRNEYR